MMCGIAEFVGQSEFLKVSQAHLNTNMYSGCFTLRQLTREETRWDVLERMDFQRNEG